MTARLYAGADFAFRSDHATCVVIARHDDFYNIVDCDDVAPARGAPLVPSVVCARFAAFVGRYGIREIGADVHYLESVREHLRGHGIAIRELPSGNAGKVAAFLGLKGLIGETRIRIAHPDIARQLKTIRKKPLAGGGLDIIQPRKRGSGHADLVSAAVAALWMAQSGVSTAMTDADREAWRASNRRLWANAARTGHDWTAGRGSWWGGRGF